MFYLSARNGETREHRMFTIGQQVTKNSNGSAKQGSARVYEIAFIYTVADLDSLAQSAYEGEAVLYSLRKVGGKGKGGVYHIAAQLDAVES
jgi:hypothetical protein